MDLLNYVIDKTYEICVYVSEEHGIGHLTNIRNQTKEICEYALNLVPDAINYIRNQTDDFCIKPFKKKQWD